MRYCRIASTGFSPAVHWCVRALPNMMIVLMVLVLVAATGESVRAQESDSQMAAINDVSNIDFDTAWAIRQIFPETSAAVEKVDGKYQVRWAWRPMGLESFEEFWRDCSEEDRAENPRACDTAVSVFESFTSFSTDVIQERIVAFRTDQDINDCYACAPMLGLACFRYEHGQWDLVSAKRDVDQVGSWGNLPSFNIHAFGPLDWGLFFYSYGMHHGVCRAYSRAIDRSFRTVVRIDGSQSDCGSGTKSTYDTEWSFDPTRLVNGHYPLILKRVSPYYSETEPPAPGTILPEEQRWEKELLWDMESGSYRAVPDSSWLVPEEALYIHDGP